MKIKTVLVADDDFELRQAIALKLQNLGLSVIRSPDASHALLGAMKVRPDLIILDINMPGGNGLAVCEMLASDPHCHNIPVIIHTGLTDALTLARCAQMGAHYVLKSPAAWEQMKAIVCDLLNITPSSSPPAEPMAAAPPDPGPLSTPTQRETTPMQTETSPPKNTPSAESAAAPQGNPINAPVAFDAVDSTHPVVLVIDDDPDVSRAIQLKLKPYDIDVLCAVDGDQACALAMQFLPDVIITDLVLPEAEGAYMYRRLRLISEIAETPIFILTGQGYPAIRQQMLSLGAAAYLTKPLVFSDLLTHLRNFIDIDVTRPLSSKTTHAVAMT